MFEQQLDEARRQLNEASRKHARGDSDAAELRRRLEDAEARALSNQTRAQHGEEASAKLGAVREEADELRSKLKRLETEKRLLEDLEVPKLRERLKEVEDELRVQRAAAAAAPAGASNDQMKAMFRDLLKEAGAGGGFGGGDAMKAEFAKLQSTIAQSLSSAGGRGGVVTEADLNAAKVSIEALFKHDAGAAVQSNINDVKVKEQTTTSDLKGKMDKLKALRNKGGKSE
jgi:chromosome segregation ATPase